MNISPSVRMEQPTADVYTDLNGLNKIKNEKSQEAALKKVAQQFESMFINIMMKSMRSANAVFEEGSMFNSSETKFYRDMYDQQLSLSMSQKKGIGIADTLYRQMNGRYGKDNDSLSQLSNTAPAAAQFTASIVREKLNPPQERIQETKTENKTENKTVSKKENQEVKFESPEEFVEALLPLAKQAADKLGVDPEYLVAQSALETGWGSKIIADDKGSSFNLFNIKASAAWQGEAVEKQTGEFKFNRWTTERAQFRKYDSFKDSFNDYVNFLQVNPRYKPTLEGQKTGAEFIQSLQKSGYATDPNYASKVNSVYHRVMAAMDTPTKAVL